MKKIKKQFSYHLMMLPGMIFLIIFSFVPMFGIIMAFQDYIPAKGILNSRWVGLENLKFLFVLPDSKQILINTVIIAFWKMVLSIIVPVAFALLLNEIRL
ncbi:MAG TPA: sugar ABC transporter permease, partial [Lachnospiraceae bacterium]|nr:sugar ABC transporter permease [Lachnospiraceae bacterium]